VAKDTLYALTVKYYGAGSIAKADALYEANRDVMKHKNDLRPGMELKIP
jgi:nucleoid-associated protein YgaU